MNIPFVSKMKNRIEELTERLSIMEKKNEEMTLSLKKKTKCCL
jgi:hypothetical protein